MAKKIQDIQAIIDQRANKKLDADLVKMAEIISNFPLLRNMNDGGSMPTIYAKLDPKPGHESEPPVYKEHSAWDFFRAYENRPGEIRYSNYLAKLRAYWLTEYIQRETLEFFNRVDELENQVKDAYGRKKPKP